MKPMKMILAVVLIIAAAGSAWASVTVNLDPYQRLRVDGWGGVVDNVMVAWADGGEYRQCAEFDISPYKGRTIISAKLEFSAGAIWAGNNVLCVDQIASDLHIDSLDFGSASLANVASNQWNNGGYSLDVTSLVASALPTSVPNPGSYPWGKGIQFRWSDSGQVNYGNGYTLSNVKLVLDTAPVPEPASVISLLTGFVGLAGVVIRRRA